MGYEAYVGTEALLKPVPLYHGHRCKSGSCASLNGDPVHTSLCVRELLLAYDVPEYDPMRL